MSKKEEKGKTVKKKAVAKKKVAKKKVVKKTTKKKVAVKRSKSAASVISPRERYEMIATMAYYRAEQRNFEPGHDVEDWLDCERMIDEMLSR